MSGGYIIDDCTAVTDLSQVTLAKEVPIESPCGGGVTIPTSISSSISSMNNIDTTGTN